MRANVKPQQSISHIRTERLPLILFAGIALVTGLVAGLNRLGWDVHITTLSIHHGAIMIGGFLGTLISLEKIIPLKRKALYIIPLLSAASVAGFAMKEQTLAFVLLMMASVGLCAVFVIYWGRERSLIYGLMFVGAVCWLIGNALLMVKGFYPLAVPWWMGFILLIISAERLELMKFLPVSNGQKNSFVALLCLYLLSCFLAFHGIGNIVATVSLAGAALWLMRYDVVAINIRKEKLTRYTGIALLTGYCALLLSGVLVWTVLGFPMGYDALLHTFFIGFVFSMIFAHGPIILPGVLGISLKPYHPIFYLWLGMLHSSWILRAFADLVLELQLRKYSGLISGVAILGYFASLAFISIRSYRARTI